MTSDYDGRDDTDSYAYSDWRNGHDNLVADTSYHGQTAPVSAPTTTNGPVARLDREHSQMASDVDSGSNSVARQKGQSRLCMRCDMPLTGQFVRALNGTFHLECFKCRVRLFDCLSASWEVETRD
jgi:hypothetical protein